MNFEVIYVGNNCILYGSHGVKISLGNLNIIRQDKKLLIFKDSSLVFSFEEGEYPVLSFDNLVIKMPEESNTKIFSMEIGKYKITQSLLAI